MTLPCTVTTVAELAEVLSHLPQDMKVIINDDRLCSWTVEVRMEKEYVTERYVEIKEQVIVLDIGKDYK